MRKASIRDLHIRTSELVREAAEGAVIQIERRGEAVAELRPLPKKPLKPKLPDMLGGLAPTSLRSDRQRALPRRRSLNMYLDSAYLAKFYVQRTRCRGCSQGNCQGNPHLFFVLGAARGRVRVPTACSGTRTHTVHKVGNSLTCSEAMSMQTSGTYCRLHPPCCAGRQL